jgi:hypothetical protein
MSLIGLILLLAVIGVVLWQEFKKIKKKIGKWLCDHNRHRSIGTGNVADAYHCSRCGIETSPAIKWPIPIL